MLEFRQDISFVALVIMAMISELHLHEKLMSWPVQVPGAPFFLCNYVKNWDVTLEFRQYISFVALVIIGMISDLHLGGKRMSRLVTAKRPKYPERLFPSVSKSNI